MDKNRNKYANKSNEDLDRIIDLKKFTWDYAQGQGQGKGKASKGSNETILNLNSPELISRILKYGNLNDWAWLIQKIKKKGLIQFLKQYSYKLDDRTFNWWRVYCGLDDSFPKAERPVGYFKKVKPIK